MDLNRAVEVFVQGFCQTKSLAHPYVSERVAGLWVLRDAPGRRKPRAIEIVAVADRPDRVHQAIREAGIGRHFLCDIRAAAAECASVRAAYKALGYRALSTEWMFVHDLREIPEYESVPPVRTVAGPDEWGRVPQSTSQRRKPLPGARQFAVWDEERDYGWVKSVPVGDSTWVSDLFVHRDVRRRGYGRALMSALLRSDAAHGAQCSVLLASSVGAKLYPILGFREIGTLQMFCPHETGS